MSWAKASDLTSMAKDVLKHIGLVDFELEIYAEADHPSAFAMMMKRRMEPKVAMRIGDRQAIFDEIMGPMIRNVAESEAVRSAKADLTQEIKLLKEEVATYTAEIERLKKYETHYEMSYLMAHGKPEVSL